MDQPIDCREAEARLQDYLKRELTAELAVEVRTHLDRCRRCFDHARFEESFLRMLEERARRERCPGPVRDRILQALRREGEQG
jgi:anti-sigma factor (TIGR02949 family)